MAVVINGTTGITSVNGSAAAPSVTGTDTDTGIVYGTNTLSLATGGTTALTIDSSQNATFAANLAVTGTPTFTGYLNAPNTFGFKNRLYNGGLQVWQNGTSFTATGYGPDQFYLSGNGTFTTTRSSTPTSPNGNYYITATTGASSSYCNYQQPLESIDVYPLRGKVVTASAWVNVTAGSFAGVFAFNAYYSTSTDARASVTTDITLTSTTGITPTSTFQQVKCTFTVPSDAVGLMITLNHSNVQPSGVTESVADFQLELGSSPTSFDARPFGTELKLCERFFEKSFDYATAPAHNTGGLPVVPIGSNLGCGGNAYWTIPFKTCKRTSSYTVRWYDPIGAHTATENWVRAITICDSGTAYGPNSNMSLNSLTTNHMAGYSQVGSNVPPIFYWTADARL